MTTLSIAAIAVASAWLLVLTLAVLLCVRQLGILSVRTELLARGGAGSGAGPTVGFSVAMPLVERYPQLGRDRCLVVLLSGNCATCYRVMEGWRAGDGPNGLMPDDVLALVTGRDGPEADQAAEALREVAEVMREPNASELARALNLTHRPSAIVLERGLVSGTAVLERAADLKDLVAGARSSQYSYGTESQ